MSNISAEKLAIKRAIIKKKINKNPLDKFIVQKPKKKNIIKTPKSYEEIDILNGIEVLSDDVLELLKNSEEERLKQIKILSSAHYEFTGISPIDPNFKILKCYSCSKELVMEEDCKAIPVFCPNNREFTFLIYVCSKGFECEDDLLIYKGLYKEYLKDEIDDTEEITKLKNESRCFNCHLNILSYLVYNKFAIYFEGSEKRITCNSHLCPQVSIESES